MYNRYRQNKPVTITPNVTKLESSFFGIKGEFSTCSIELLMNAGLSANFAGIFLAIGLPDFI